MTRQHTAASGCTNFKLRQLLRAVSRIYDTRLAQVGLRGTQYSTLSHIVRLGPIQPGELARRLGMDASTLTRTLRPLIAQGWAELGPGPDARTRLIHATEAGRDKRSEAQRHWRGAQLELTERLGAAHVAALHALIDLGLERLPARLEDAP